MSKSSQFKKVALIILVMIFPVFFGLNLFYNQNKEALAQEEEISQVLKCEEEIPIGLAIDTTLITAKTISDGFETIMQLATAQVNAAKELAKLPSQCRPENCDTNCHEECETDPDTGETTCTCVKPTCRGKACPEGEITSKFNIIDAHFNNINDSYKEIDDIVNKPVISLSIAGNLSKSDYVGYLLNISRQKMQECIASADFFRGEEAWGGWLLKCDEVAYQGLLPQEDMGICRDAEEYIRMSILGELNCCYVNNFYCCE